MNIVLPAEGWTIQGNVVTIEGATSTSRYALPRGSRRIVTETLGKGRTRLILGGFKSVTVSVCGPAAEIEALREAVL